MRNLPLSPLIGGIRELTWRMEMKYILVLFVFGIILFLAYQGEAKIDPESVVGIWLLDEGSGTTIRDSSGNGHNGEIVGNVNWVQGKFGKALEFPGSGENIARVLPDSALQMTTFTVVAWFKGESTGSWQKLVGREGPWGSRNFNLYVNKGTESLMTQFTVGAQNWKSAIGKTTISDGDWHHLAGTYDGHFIRSWVDGTKDAETAETGEPDHAEGAYMSIGGEFTLDKGFGLPVKGIIDDVALFNVALGEEDINELMTGGLSDTLGIFAVSPQEKLTTIWGELKSK